MRKFMTVLVEKIVFFYWTPRTTYLNNPIRSILEYMIELLIMNETHALNKLLIYFV